MEFLSKNKDKIFIIGFTLFISLFIFYCTSPLIKTIGSDSGIFLLIGKLLSYNKTFYVDLFDHKGPILFFIEGIPQIFIKGTTGVWLTEALFLGVSLIIIYEIGKNILKDKRAILLPFLYLLYMVKTLEGGNLTEEYSNLFNLIGLYIFIRFTNEKYDYLKNKHCMYLGICFTIIALIRVNNAAILVSIILYMLVYTLINKKENLLKYILYGFLGVGIVLLPICLYFLFNHSLYDMFYATFLYNFKYSNGGLLNNLINVFKMNNAGEKVRLLFILGIGSGIFGIIKKDYNYGIFNIINTVVTIVAISASGKGYLHYAMVGAPLYIFSYLIILKNLNIRVSDFMNKISIIFAIIIFGYTSYFQANIFKEYISLKDINNYYTEVRELANNIPTEDRNSVFGYNVSAKWFYVADIIPCYKYFTLQDWWAKNDKEIINKVVEMLNKKSPKWIVLEDIEGIESMEVKNIIKNKYIKVFENETGYLYKIKAE